MHSKLRSNPSCSNTNRVLVGRLTDEIFRQEFWFGTLLFSLRTTLQRKHAVGIVIA